ncbi:hypothetical protein V6N12_019201 [Hibiscus sabdariffa]|uniref:Uncharacterized protein n=1 Tax=Hibiscus sabdariffa TaxID=183260 RepID=A0ABR1ZN61_9ROSI
MGNCCLTSSTPSHKKKGKKKQNPFSIDYGQYRQGNRGHKLIVLSTPTGREIEQRYELGRELEHSEFGIMYLCTDKETSDTFACKSISKKKLRTSVDIEDDYNAVHLVMELCKGGELFEKIVARGLYTERAVVVTKTIVEVVQLLEVIKLNVLAKILDSKCMISSLKHVSPEQTFGGLTTFARKGLKDMGFELPVFAGEVSQLNCVNNFFLLQY